MSSILRECKIGICMGATKFARLHLRHTKALGFRELTARKFSADKGKKDTNLCRNRQKKRMHQRASVRIASNAFCAGGLTFCSRLKSRGSGRSQMQKGQNHTKACKGGAKLQEKLNKLTTKIYIYSMNSIKIVLTLKVEETDALRRR